ncbi:MAG: universal stress protein, partial [Phycisphaerae bacterium]|nr:universal stress protein [Phycisphaerae bacterium]
TLGWIAVGLFLYYAIFEKRAAVIEPQVLLPGQPQIELETEPSVLVALHNPDTVKTLLDFAIPIAKQRKLPVVAVSIVQVPTQIPIHEGMRFTHHKESLLTQAKKVAAEGGTTLETDLVIAHHISDGILAAANRHRANALVMGWKGFTNARDRIFGEIADRIIRLAPCDLLLLKIGERQEFRRCLLPTAGGPNAYLATTILGAIAKDHDLSVTAGYFVPENASREQKKIGEQRIDETLEHIDKSIKYEKQIIESKTVAGGIASASRNYDLVVIGAAKEPLFRKMLFGEIPEKVARFSPTSVLVVKKYEGAVKSMVKKVMG